LPTLGYTFVFPLGQGAIARVFSTFPEGLDSVNPENSVNPVKKVILPLKIVADPVPQKAERNI
jgi:hypothetical protein